MRRAIFGCIQLGQLTEGNFDQWKVWVEEFPDGIHLSRRRNPSSEELEALGPWSE